MGIKVQMEIHISQSKSLAPGRSTELRLEITLLETLLDKGNCLQYNARHKIQNLQSFVSKDFEQRH